METAPQKTLTTPRRYQEELLKRCINQNSILYLPTGSGKTYIAVMFIKEIMQECCMKYGHGQKLAVFAVNQVALAQQQADYISRHVDFNVGCYTGIMNVDYWDKNKWNEEFKKNQVLVMTVQILCNIMVHNIINVNNICVAVFDECHAATGNHPMKQAADNILKLHTNPKLLGLSGSLINGDCKVARVVRCLKDLEDTFKSRIVTAAESLLPEVRRYSTNPEEEIHRYEVPVIDSFMETVTQLLTQCQEIIMQSKMTDQTTHRNRSLYGLKPMSDDMKQNKELKNILENVKYQLEDLGLFGGYEAAKMYITALNRLAVRTDTAVALDVITIVKETVTEVREALERQMMGTAKPSDRVRRFTSKKFTRFISLIEQIFQEIPGSECSQNGNNNTLVFVKRRASARTLSALLKILSESDLRLRAMKPSCVVGYGAQQSNEVTEMHRKTNEEAIERFRNKKINLLVATDVLEEGIDIPICNTVIMFDPPNSCRSYIQSKGRARHKTSSYHIFVCNGDTKFFDKFHMYKAVGQEISKVLRPGAIAVEVDMDSEPDDGCVEWHIPHGAILKGSYAIQLVNIYSCKLPHDRFTNLAPLWYLLNREEKCVCFVQLPVNAILKVTIEGEPQVNKRLAKQSAAIEAVKQLYACGELDDNMIPRPNEHIVYHEKLFPYLTKEPVSDSSPPQGSKRRKQLYVRRCPLMFSDCRPQELQVAYLHIIKIETAYPKPIEESDDMLLYQMLNEDEHFGILSSKEIPQKFTFPLHSSEGKLKVTVMTCELHMLSKEQICYCEEFHQFIFSKVLNLVKPFMSVDHERRDYSYLIVPVRKSGDGFLDIDWSTMSNTRKASVNKESEMQQDGDSQKSSAFSVFMQRHLSGKRQFYLIANGHEVGKHHMAADGVTLVGGPIGAVKEAILISTDLNCLKKKQLQENCKRRKCYFNPDFCDAVPLPAVLCLKIHLLPSALHKLSIVAAAYEFCQKIPISEGIILHYKTNEDEDETDIQLLDSDFKGCGLKLNDIEQALTAASCDDRFNSETLETLGDSFLKFAVSLFLFIHFKNHHEGTLSTIKNRIVSNWHFYNVGKAKDIGSKLQIHRFTPDETWLPPGYNIPQAVRRKFLSDHIAPEFLKNLNLSGAVNLTDELVGKENSWNLSVPNNYELLISVQTASDKALADSLEALTGVYLKAYGLYGATALLNSLGVLPEEKASPYILFGKPPEKPLLQQSLPYQYVDFHLGDTEELEKTLNYKFKDRGFLLQALTHPSFSDNRITDCYQRLEFLGDAILDFLVTSYIYDKCQKLSPGKITILRAALVNNSTFAAFALKIGLQKYCKYRSSELFYNIDAFVKFQQENNHEITDEVTEEEEEEEEEDDDDDDRRIKQDDDDDDDDRRIKPASAPKVLGDLFESVAAAIYLDSGKSLKTVWSSYYKIMEKELVKYCT